jgi:hypothetical protein
MAADRLGQKPLGRLLVSVLRQQEIDRLAACEEVASFANVPNLL